MKSLWLILALATCASAFAASPGKAALSFLDQLREGNLDLNPGADTAISPHVSPKKLEQITNRLNRMTGELGQQPLEPGREKIDGDFAGVLLWKTHGFDASQMQVFAVAMIRREGKWLPAPVPASFENCGVSYDAEVRARIQALETWMLRGKSEDLLKLRQGAITRMQDNIGKHITRKTLQNLQPKQALERFLEACKRRNGYEVLGLVGGLSTTLPEDWAARAASIEAATSSTDTSSPWRLLMSPNVLRVTVDIDEEFGPLHASIACLDPQSPDPAGKHNPRIELVHLKLSKSAGGLWQIELPDRFWLLDKVATDATDDELDRDLLDRFATKIRNEIPPQPSPTPAAARDALIDALQNGSFPQLLQHTAVNKDPLLGRMAILRAAEVWGAVHALPSAHQPQSAHQVIDIDMEVKEQAAVVIHHVFSARKPDLFTPAELYLENAADGWLWSPNPSDETRKPFRDWIRQQSEGWKTNWRQLMLKDCPALDKIPAAPAPSDDEAKAVVNRWFKAVEAGDIREALAQCTILKSQDNGSQVMVLRNLGYEMVDALRKNGNGSIRHVLSDGPWAAVGANPRNAESETYTLYPVISTPAGPRILLEIDLIASSGRGREFLNRSNLNRLKTFNADAAQKLEDLFLKHRQQCLGDAVER